MARIPGRSEEPLRINRHPKHRTCSPGRFLQIMANQTPYRLRITNRRLRILVKRMVRMWGAHLRQLAPKAMLTRGRFSRLIGEYTPGSAPNPRQEILIEGAYIVDAAMAHALLSTEVSVRLLTSKGGQPLPWSSMVLARTALEATLRVLWLLDPIISEDLLLARIAASAFEELEESRKLHIDLPDELRREPLAQIQERVQGLILVLEASEFSVYGDGRGYVATPSNERVAFPLVMVDASKRWWGQRGVHTYRWLSGFTHAGSANARHLKVPVAAIDSASVYAILALLTDSVWKSIDSYSMWIGIPNGMVRRKLARIYAYLKQKAPEGVIQERQPSEIESMFLGMEGALSETGIVHPKTLKKFRDRYVRRIDI